jgi:DNA-binding FadR family transcriptional regulator
MDEPVQHDMASLTPLNRSSVTREVTGRLFDYLMSGGLTPGSRLPSERRLAEALQVGRSAIRETLAAFEVLGIVDSRPGSGTYLRSHSADLLPTVINWGLTLGQPRTLDLVEARAELEVITARFAAERATTKDIGRLRAHLDRMAETVDSWEEFVAADVAFHLEIADIAGNTVLSDLLHSVRVLLQVWIDRAVRAEGTSMPTLAEHRRVFEAVQSGDGELAQAAMKTHMRSASNRLRRSIEEQAERSDAPAEPPPARRKRASADPSNPARPKRRASEKP